MSVPGWNDGRFLPDDEGPEACPQNRRSVTMMIARSIIDGVGSAANVARRHLHRGQFRIPEPMRLEVQSCSRVVYSGSVRSEGSASPFLKLRRPEGKRGPILLTCPELAF